MHVASCMFIKTHGSESRGQDMTTVSYLHEQLILMGEFIATEYSV